MKKYIILLIIFVVSMKDIEAQKLIPSLGFGSSTLAWYAGQGYKTRPKYTTIDVVGGLYLGNTKTKYRKKDVGIWPGIIVQLPLLSHRMDFFQNPLSQNFETFTYMDQTTNADLSVYGPLYGAEVYSIVQNTEERYLSKIAFGGSLRIHHYDGWYLLLEPLVYVYSREMITTQEFSVMYHNQPSIDYGEPYVEVVKNKNLYTYGVNFGWGMERYALIIGLQNIGIPTSTVAIQGRIFFD